MKNTKLEPGTAELIPYNCNGYFEKISLDTPDGLKNVAPTSTKNKSIITIKITISYLQEIF